MTAPSSDVQELPSSAVQLLDVFPISMHAVRYPMPSTERFTAQPTLKMSLLVGLTEGNLCNAELKAAVTFEPDPHPFELEATVLGMFQPADQMDPQELLTMTQRVALPILFPFLREVVFELCLRLRVQPVLIPLIAAQVVTKSPVLEVDETESSPKGKDDHRSPPGTRPHRTSGRAE